MRLAGVVFVAALVCASVTGAEELTATQQWCIDEGLMLGASDGRFEPDRELTGYELAQVLARIAAMSGRAAILPGGSVPAETSDPRYPVASVWDVPNDSWAFYPVLIVYDLGVFDGAFSGPGACPRGELAASLTVMAHLTDDAPETGREAFEGNCVRRLLDAGVSLGEPAPNMTMQEYVRVPVTRGELAGVLAQVAATRLLPWQSAQWPPEEPLRFAHRLPPALLRVEGVMQGAAVFINGEERGTIPCEIAVDLRRVGSREVEVAAWDGFQRPAIEQLTLVQGDVTTWQPAMPTDSGWPNAVGMYENPEEPPPPFDRALEALSSGRVERAIARAEEAALVAPNAPDAVGLLGMLRQVRGDREAALALYDRQQQLSFRVEPLGSHSIEQLSEAESLLVWLVNEERLKGSLPPLLPDWRLCIVARAHSDEMLGLNYFSHVSPIEGRATCMQRYEQTYGLRPRLIAENLARRRASFYCFDLDRIADSHQGLMESPGHREAILLNRVDRIGVGVAVGDGATYYITELFARM